jgi:hypothetical protein
VPQIQGPMRDAPISMTGARGAVSHREASFMLRSSVISSQEHSVASER